MYSNANPLNMRFSLLPVEIILIIANYLTDAKELISFYMAIYPQLEQKKQTKFFESSGNGLFYKRLSSYVATSFSSNFTENTNYHHVFAKLQSILANIPPDCFKKYTSDQHYFNPPISQNKLNNLLYMLVAEEVDIASEDIDLLCGLGANVNWKGPHHKLPLLYSTIADINIIKNNNKLTVVLKFKDQIKIDKITVLLKHGASFLPTILQKRIIKQPIDAWQFLFNEIFNALNEKKIKIPISDQELVKFLKKHQDVLPQYELYLAAATGRGYKRTTEFLLSHLEKIGEQLIYNPIVVLNEDITNYQCILHFLAKSHAFSPDEMGIILETIRRRSPDNFVRLINMLDNQNNSPFSILIQTIMTEKKLSLIAAQRYIELFLSFGAEFSCLNLNPAEYCHKNYGFYFDRSSELAGIFNFLAELEERFRQESINKLTSEILHKYGLQQNYFVGRLDQIKLGTLLYILIVENLASDKDIGILCRSGAHPNVTDAHHFTLLYHAIFNVIQIENNQVTSFQLSIKDNLNFSVIKQLIHYGAFCGYLVNGQTIIHELTYHIAYMLCRDAKSVEHFELLLNLLQIDNHFNLHNQDGQTPILYAASKMNQYGNKIIEDLAKASINLSFSYEKLTWLINNVVHTLGIIRNNSTNQSPSIVNYHFLATGNGATNDSISSEKLEDDLDLDINIESALKRKKCN